MISKTAVVAWVFCCTRKAIVSKSFALLTWIKLTLPQPPWWLVG